MNRLDHYTSLSYLFRYPDDQMQLHLEEIASLIETRYPGAKQFFSSFRNEYLKLSLKEWEEYFVRTFEVEALCCMDIGFVLFGEDYKRGDFLSQMQREQTIAGNPLGSELADHLPNVLTLLPKFGDMELAKELGWCILVPAITEILKKFESANNYYKHAFEMIHFILTYDFNDPELKQYEIKHAGPEFTGAENYACGSDFLSEIGKPKF